MIQSWELAQRQSLPLESKIQFSVNKIREFINRVEAEATVSFSGGIDSTVLLDLVRRRTGYSGIKAVFANTGLEFPQIVDFVCSVPNVEIVRPKISFYDCLKKYGYPVVSKRVAEYVGQCQSAKSKTTATYILRTTGKTIKGKLSPLSKIPNKWQHLIDAPFKVSAMCCKILKKDPMKGFRAPIIGTMADDSSMRRQSYLSTGCNTFSGAGGMCRPLSIWTSADIWEYVRKYDLRYSKIYDMGYTSTGCIFCPFGLGLEKRPNRFERMAVTHPKLLKYCMDTLGFGPVLDFVYQNEKKQQTFGLCEFNANSRP